MKYTNNYIYNEINNNDSIYFDLLTNYNKWFNTLYDLKINYQGFINNFKQKILPNIDNVDVYIEEDYLYRYNELMIKGNKNKIPFESNKNINKWIDDREKNILIIIKKYMKIVDKSNEEKEESKKKLRIIYFGTEKKIDTVFKNYTLKLKDQIKQYEDLEKKNVSNVDLLDVSINIDKLEKHLQHLEEKKKEYFNRIYMIVDDIIKGKEEEYYISYTNEYESVYDYVFSKRIEIEAEVSVNFKTILMKGV